MNNPIFFFTAPISRSLSFIFALSSLWLLSACDNSSWTLKLYDPQDPHQQHLSQEMLGKRLMLINYWAEWCKPCIEEIPELNHFAKQYADQVMVLGFNFDNKQAEELTKAMNAVNMQFPALLTNPSSVFTLPEINGLPTTLIVDSEGNVIQILLGPQNMISLEASLSKKTTH